MKGKEDTHSYEEQGCVQPKFRTVLIPSKLQLLLASLCLLIDPHLAVNKAENILEINELQDCSFSSFLTEL